MINHGPDSKSRIRCDLTAIAGDAKTIRFEC